MRTTAAGGRPEKPGRSIGARKLDVAGIVRLLGDRVDGATAVDVVRATAESLGLPGPTYDRDEVVAILDRLAADDGVMAVVARFAKARALLTLR